MMYPDDFYYTKDHEWIEVKGEVATVGITDFAQKQLGDVVYVELPQVGISLEFHQSMGVVESVKAWQRMDNPH
jgi:glycine cleavage system H protein